MRRLGQNPRDRALMSNHWLSEDSEDYGWLLPSRDLVKADLVKDP